MVEDAVEEGDSSVLSSGHLESSPPCESSPDVEWNVLAMVTTL